MRGETLSAQKSLNGCAAAPLVALRRAGSARGWLFHLARPLQVGLEPRWQWKRAMEEEGSS
eukprot:4962141-Pyramimonas_sp.AAC.1